MLSVSAILIPILISSLILWLSHSPPMVPAPFADGPITLVIAHPDDESMFFSPTLLALTPQTRVRIWCLSSGNAEGLGAVRMKELHAAAKMLGVGIKDVIVLDDKDGLKDEMGRMWSEEEVGTILTKLESEHGKSMAWITFDEGGVSGHANHKSVALGLRKYLQNAGRKDDVWVLESVNLLRKYSFWLEAAFAQVKPVTEGKVRFISSWEGYRTAQKAMIDGHVSQMVWFRWGWIVLGRYMIVNELVKV